MQRRFTSVVLAGFVGALVLMTTPSISLAWPYHSIGWRMHNQQGRIYHGVRQGQITGREYRRLEREQFRTAQLRYRFRHNDGHIGPRERTRLQHRLNHTSRHIYRARHN
jgi:hypothetical protein